MRNYHNIIQLSYFFSIGAIMIQYAKGDKGWKSEMDMQVARRKEIAFVLKRLNSRQQRIFLLSRKVNKCCEL
jgi:hypothetical protein